LLLAQTPVISMQTFLKVFIVHGLLFGFCIFFAYIILRRDRKWLNTVVSLFYIFVAIGFFVNFIYVLISMEPFQETVLLLHKVTLFFLLLGTYFLTLFSLILLKTETIFNRKKQAVLTSILILSNSVLFFLPISMGPETNWNPVYSLEYYTYLFIVFTIFSVLPQVYCFFKIYNRIEQDFLLKRWKSFITGTILFYIMCYGTITYHYLDIQIIRTIWSLISLFLSIGAMFFIYYGVSEME